MDVGVSSKESSECCWNTLYEANFYPDDSNDSINVSSLLILSVQKEV